MTDIRNRAYTEGHRVELDDNSYFDCQFLGCTIVFSATGPVVIDSCMFTKVKWVMEGAAAHTVDFLTNMYKLDSNLVEPILEGIRAGVPPSS